MMKINLLFVLLISVTVSVAQTRYITKLDGSKMQLAAIDKLVLQLMDTAHVTGIAIAVLNNNKIAFTKAYGLKSVSSKEPLDTATIFCAASLSKAMFAFINMLLVQQGLLDLDKPLYQYLPKPLPEYEKYAELAGDNRWKLITARMCLSHTTGFPNWRFLNAVTGAFEAAGKLKIYVEPGTKYAYSGEGLVLLQMVIEQITGKNLEELAAEKIFTPIGLRNTSYTWQPRFETNFAYGHNGQGEQLGKKKRKKPGAAGSLETSLADYARFIEYIMQGKGLNSGLKKMMLSPQIPIYSKYQFPTISADSTNENSAIQLSYGLGWGLLTTVYGKAFFKEGHDDDGWQHYTINFMDKGTSILIMSNSLNAEKIFKPLLEQLIGDKFTPWKWERYLPYNY